MLLNINTKKWLERLAMEKSDKLDGSKGFEILYLCHPQAGQASKEEKIKAELYGALQLLLGGAPESYTQLMYSQHTAKASTLLHPSTALNKVVEGLGKI